MSTFLGANATNFKAGRSAGIAYIVVHYTANDGDTARGNASYFHNNANLNASAHYFVDENEIYQSVKEANTAWHCGAKAYKHPSCRNYNSLGVELCSRKDSAGKYYFKAETLANAVVLVKSLMAKYGIDTNHVIRHYDVTGKNCPAPFVEDERAWRAFKASLGKNTNKGDDEEMVTKTKIQLNGKIIEVDTILKDGHNYIQLRDLAPALDIGYDAAKKMPVVKNK